MTLLEAIVLGIIQGVAEFLPVSSSGHLLVFHRLFGIESNDNLTFLVVLNLGSLLPLLYTYRADLLPLIRQPFQKLSYLLIIATLPIIVVTLLFEDHIDTLFQATQFLGVGFVLTGILLIVSDKINKNSLPLTRLRYVDALMVGMVQSIAIFPGISRSGSTMSAALLRGMTREDAAKFSFLMSIPTAVGAMAFRVLGIMRGNVSMADINVVNMVAGFLAAAITGYLSINFTLGLVKSAKLKYFAMFYVFGLAVIIFLFF